VFVEDQNDPLTAMSLCAIGELEEAYRSRAVRTTIIGDPFFSELGGDARYRDLLTRLRLPFQPS
jgi:hypothetical protein